MMIVSKIKCALLVLLAVHSVHATTIPDNKGPPKPPPGPPGHGPPVHPPPPPPSPTHSTKPSSTSSSRTSSVSTHFSTPPASLNVPASFSAGPHFSTDFLKEFYPGFGPTQTSVEPQPIITDPVSHSVFPLDLTNPKTIPTANLKDPVVLPPSLLSPNSPIIISPQTNLSTPGSIELRNIIFDEIKDILTNTTKAFTSTCGQCISSLALLKQLALTAPWEVPPILVELCEFTSTSAFGSCAAEFSANSDGDVTTQVIANADVTGVDGELMCARGIIPLRKSCPTPPPIDLTDILKTWFKKPKPANYDAPKPSGKTPLRVLHLSDLTLAAPGQTILPAPRYGAYECDTPWLLADAVMHAIPSLTGINTALDKDGKPATFGIFTGDLTSHDNDNQLGRDYVKYVEVSVFSLFKHYFGDIPFYAAMGNHDTWPQAFDAPHSLQPAALGNEFEWDYGHLADLWQTEGWISEQVAAVSKKEFSAYSTITPFGLKVITINTDFWYTGNGMLRFLTDELQEAEDNGQRVWIVGHVLSGWGTSNALGNGPNLFYQIVDRYSPKTIAGIFKGHIHDEVRYLYYKNNGTVMDADSAVAVTMVGGSVTPLAGLNSGFSMYEVDPETFDIMEAHVWYANVSEFSDLDHKGQGVTYRYEYSTRDTYGVDFDWPETSPLNATWWHKVTESFEQNPDLVNQFNHNQGRQSPLTQNCTSTECVTAKVCYMRSGSPQLSARCNQGFTSVQA
ncbi:hypothetical protein Clacol_006027 [Clathrus columnatus]|uniref:Calcineurin-like phosphoesterase domain-containing protein n=1 Tax=Clathrus columnatus TaxID=1419009 RepID=A0AAV5AAZ5_9AGAM|nr:hypothetical protein Clacol_006027 [Clathrus columnatus]